LSAQNADLHKTIEDLNACFLTFTDDLVASGWLEQDPQVTKSLQGTIEQFITVAQASQALKEDNSASHDEDNSGSEMTESPALETTQDVALSVNESTNDISNSGMGSSMIVSTDLNDTFSRSHSTAASGPKDIVIQPVQNNVIFEAHQAPTSFQNVAYEVLSAHMDALNYKPQLERSINSFKLTFAQRLHMEAIRAGLRLACNAEDSSQLFYRVFNRVLDLATRESYKALLSKILEETFDQSRQTPPESDLDRRWSGGESYVWLHASDVASHFRSIGMDFDSSLDVVNVELNPRSLPNIWGDMQELSTYQQFTEAAQYGNECGIYTIDPTFSYKGYRKSSMSVDVSRLIHGKYLVIFYYGESWLTCM
jgi:hypothetical protein